MAYSVRHITNFDYQPAVRESVMEVRVQPRSETRQRCLSFSLDVTPRANVMLYRDFLGNTVHHFDIPGQHGQIQVSAHALVEVMASPVPQPEDVKDWQELDACISGGDFWEMLLPSQYTQPTPLLEEFASELRVERHGNPMELLLELNEALYHALAYVPNSTKVDSPIDDALRARQGVCQDFAHIMTALVRQLRIPCRYVSGYLFHEADSKDRSSAGATHAWVEAFLGDAGWVAFDPTNRLIGSERHIRVALGRDYADVAPTRGVYKGDAESTLSVVVTVAPVNSPEPEELPPATVIRSRSLNPRTGNSYEDQQQQ
ncbi:MAG TPA: transglutaminase family protein [Candidatus Dormibacteraeota bacterium]|nr:transglutaminase family protein [Candidatus Dormibacteraeota bacterium]